MAAINASAHEDFGGEEIYGFLSGEFVTRRALSQGTWIRKPH